MTAQQHIENLRKAVEYMEQLEAKLAEEQSDLHIAIQALRAIADWTDIDGARAMIRSRALDTLRLIGKEGEGLATNKDA